MKKKFWEPINGGLYPIAIVSGFILALAISCVVTEYIQAVTGEISRILAMDMPHNEAVIFLAKMSKMDVASMFIPFSQILYTLRLSAVVPSVLLVSLSAVIFGTVIIGTKKQRSKIIQSIGIAMTSLAIGTAVNIMFGAASSSKHYLLMILVMVVLFIFGLIVVRITMTSNSKSNNK